MTPENDLRKNWNDFWDADYFKGIDDFAERMEAAGLVELDDVTPNDLENIFAADRGIEPDGKIYRLTSAGRAALATPPDNPAAPSGNKGGE